MNLSGGRISDGDSVPASANRGQREVEPDLRQPAGLPSAERPPYARRKPAPRDWMARSLPFLEPLWPPAPQERRAGSVRLAKRLTFRRRVGWRTSPLVLVRWSSDFVPLPVQNSGRSATDASGLGICGCGSGVAGTAAVRVSCGTSRLLISRLLEFPLRAELLVCCAGPIRLRDPRTSGPGRSRPGVGVFRSSWLRAAPTRTAESVFGVRPPARASRQRDWRRPGCVVPLFSGFAGVCLREASRFGLLCTGVLPFELALEIRRLALLRLRSVVAAAAGCFGIRRGRGSGWRRRQVGRGVDILHTCAVMSRCLIMQVRGHTRFRHCTGS